MYNDMISTESSEIYGTIRDSKFLYNCIRSAVDKKIKLSDPCANNDHSLTIDILKSGVIIGTLIVDPIVGELILQHPASELFYESVGEDELMGNFNAIVSSAAELITDHYDTLCEIHSAVKYVEGLLSKIQLRLDAANIPNYLDIYRTVNEFDY